MTPRRRRQMSALTLGKIFVALSLVAGALLFQKAQISSMLRSGEEIEVQFKEAHRLRTSISDVKLAGVEVGVVRSVEREGDLTVVKLKVDEDALEKLGTAPSAAIRPATLLGGNYYVELKPGGRAGDFSGKIPVDRTKLPVELDGLASAFPSDARSGVSSSTKNLDETLTAGGTESLRKLLKAAPGTLDSTEKVLLGLQGTERERDLETLVSTGENASKVLSSQNANLAGIVENLDTTANVLEARRVDLAEATRIMPETLDETLTMLNRLDGVLNSLEITADPARPAVSELSTLLKNADPVLARARPLVADLRGVLRDARPLVNTLIPTTRDLDATVNNLNGTVINRVNGPILEALRAEYKGPAGSEYEDSFPDKSRPDSGGDEFRPLYMETGYMLENLARGGITDQNGYNLSFMAAVGLESLQLGGFDLNGVTKLLSGLNSDAVTKLFSDLFGGTQ